MANVWFMLRDGRRFGPFQFAQLQQMTTTGQLLPLDLLAQAEGGPWVPASQVPGLYDAAPPTANAPTQDAEPAFDFGGAEGQLEATAHTDTSARPRRSQRNSSGRSRRTAFVVVAGCGLLLLIATGVYFASRDTTKGANSTGKSGEVGQPQTGVSRPGSGATSQSYAGGFEAGVALGKRNAETWANPKLNSSARQSLQKSFTKTHDENMKKYEDARGRFGESHDAVQRLKGIADGYREERFPIYSVAAGEFLIMSFFNGGSYAECDPGGAGPRPRGRCAALVGCLRLARRGREEEGAGQDR